MFANIFWGCEKPELILRDNRALNRFFQTKINPPTLSNALDLVLTFNIILGHIPGKTNLEADNLSRIHEPEMKPSIITLLLETSEENTRKHYLFQTVNETDQTDIKEEVHIQQIRPAQLQAIDKHNPKDDINTTGHTIKSMSPLSTGQNISTDLKKYVNQYPRVAMFNGVLHRMFYNHTSNSFIKKLRVPIHLPKEVLFRIHNSVWSGHRVSRTILGFQNDSISRIPQKRLLTTSEISWPVYIQNLGPQQP